MKIRLLVAGGAALLTILLTGSPLAVAQIEHNPRDLALLPRFCFGTYSFRHLAQPGEEARYKQLLGTSIMHLHHYCWGLMHTNNALLFSKTKTERMRSLSHSIREFDYTIRKVEPSFPLLPEILTKKGENLIRLNQGEDGVAQLKRAIELKADYWPPYVAISDYYRDAGDRTQALEWLDKGLVNVPESKILQSRKAQLTGAERKSAAARKPSPTEKAEPKADDGAAPTHQGNLR